VSVDPLRLTRWQRLRTAVFLFFAGMLRRLTFGTRAMLIDGDKVLLIRHTYLPGWQFPGGGVEPGETALHSIGREVLEETGCRMDGSAELFGLYHNARLSARDHVALYVCRSVEREREFRANHEIAAAQWFAIGDLPADVTAGTRRRIDEVFHGKPVDPVW